MDPEILGLLENEKPVDSEVIIIVESAELRAGWAKYHAISLNEARERTS